MPVTRRRFACGHKGHGSVCRRCLQAKKLHGEAERLGQSWQVLNEKREKTTSDEDNLNRILDKWEEAFLEAERLARVSPADTPKAP